MTKGFVTVLQSILDRKRHPVPSVVLTGQRFNEKSVYHLLDIKNTPIETKRFCFAENNSDKIDFSNYTNELLYLKLFTTTIQKPYSNILVWKHITKSTAIIKITDCNKQIFYMYIKLELKGHCASCDGNNELKYKIVYSSCFEDLITSIYKPKEIPDFLSSDAFVSTEDKTTDQNTILKSYRDSCVYKINYDNSMVIVVDRANRTISTTISDKTFRTRYKARHEWIVNEIITHGSETILVRFTITQYEVEIIVSNAVETVKTFFLKIMQ